MVEKGNTCREIPHIASIATPKRHCTWLPCKTFNLLLITLLKSQHSVFPREHFCILPVMHTIQPVHTTKPATCYCIHKASLNCCMIPYMFKVYMALPYMPYVLFIPHLVGLHAARVHQDDAIIEIPH